MPEGFNHGIISPIYKSGDRSQPANYRPITLLNADYKILARMLATRFAKAMTKSVGSEQSAFLPGRRIGDGVALTQLVPAMLSVKDRPGGVVLLDIAKA